MTDGAIQNRAAYIWSAADLLRGDYKQSEYGRVIRPLAVLRRLNCVLGPTKRALLARHAELADRIENLEPVLQAVSGEEFFNLRAYIGGFSDTARDGIDDTAIAVAQVTPAEASEVAA